MNLSACYISHKTSLIKEREPFQISKNELQKAIKQFQRINGVSEAAIILTCNRIEFYCVDSQKHDMLALVERFYKEFEPEVTVDSSKWQVRQGSSVARHLFKVTSGLDSAVLGEYQVLHQVKEAYSAACAVSAAGKYLHKLFHNAFQVSKKIRGGYHFSDGAQGFSGSAVDLLLERDDVQLSDSRLTIVGINELTETIAGRLKDRVGHITLVNRTLYKAEKFARTINADAVELSELPRILEKTDILISMTSAEEYILDADTLSDSACDNPMIIIDMAFPRDIDPDVCAAQGVELYDLDDLKAHLKQIEDERVELLPEALDLVEEQVLTFESWRNNLLNGNHADLRKTIELDRIELTNKFSDYFKDGEQKALEAFSKSLYKQFLRRINSDPAIDN